MSDITARLAQLGTLLRDPTSEGRRALLECVMELYAGGAEACSDAARDGFGYLLGDLSRLVDVDTRADLAVRLIDFPKAPQQLVEQLAHDEIEVAAPLLVHSSALSDTALRDVINERGGEHAAAISLRTVLSADIAGRILALAYAPALARLAENPGIEFTRADYEILVSQAPDDASLQTALIKRVDLPADVAIKLPWHVSPAMGWQALQCALSVDADLLAHALDVAGECNIPRGRPTDHPADAMSFAQTKQQRRELKEPLIVRLLRDDEMDAFYACLDLLSGIDRATALAIMQETTGYPLAVACKAAGFARSTFSTLLRLSDPSNSRDLQQTFMLMNTYDAISTGDAQRLTNYWQTVFSGADLADLPSEDVRRKAG